MDLVIVCSGVRAPVSIGTISLTFEEFVRIVKSGAILGRFFRYRDVVFYTPYFYAYPRPFLTVLLCRLLARRHCRVIDRAGAVQDIGFLRILRELSVYGKEFCSYKKAIARVRQELKRLESLPKQKKALDSALPPVFLRYDPNYGIVAGGSIGHIAGVLNSFASYFEEAPLFISSDLIPTVSVKIETRIIKNGAPYRNFKNLPSIFYNDVFYREALELLKTRRIGFVYQRNALNCYTGIKIAGHLKVPFVLEYNGSDVWIEKNWGKRRISKTLDISVKIEKLSFQKADLIVCVSAALKSELIANGVDASKILVNPNGVAETVYRPEIDGSEVRARYGIQPDERVIGFIGTFGPWHGAEILAEAFAALRKGGVSCRLFLIGDGLRRHETKAILSRAGVLESCVFAGLVPQAEGPRYLAACDILASPTVPTPDATPFFGSPTKLFEYMAMGKAIAASNLDQPGEILEHEKTALLCKPGDAASLQEALLQLVEDKELCIRLGKAAREEVVKKYTWKIHTGKIITMLKGLVSRYE